MKASPDNRMFDNYSVASIYNEIRWAIGDGAPYNSALHLLELFPGQYSDLHLHSRVPLCNLKTAVERRARIAEATRTILSADAIIMTLGLAEVWWDKVAGLYLNTKPHDAACLAFPDRFELHVLGYDDVSRFLDLTFELIFRHCRPETNVILTVSPVPLTATFTDSDVCVANQYSKAVLRAAASAITQKHPRVDYFPAYESVILSDRSIAWADDLVHVREELVTLIVQAMIAAYASDPEVEVSAPSSASIAQQLIDVSPILDKAQSLMKARDFAQVVHLLERTLDDGAIGPLQIGKVLRLLGRALMTVGKFVEAEQRFRQVLQTSFNDAATHDYLGRVLVSQGRPDEALAAFENALAFNPASSTAAAQLSNCLVGAERFDEARAILNRALSIHPKDAGLLRVKETLPLPM